MSMMSWCVEMDFAGKTGSWGITIICANRWLRWGSGRHFAKADNVVMNWLTLWYSWMSLLLMSLCFARVVAVVICKKVWSYALCALG